MTQRKSPVGGMRANVLANLAIMPFSTSAELTAIRGYRSVRAVYTALRRLQTDGYVSSVPHSAINATKPTNRFFVTERSIEHLPAAFQTDIHTVLRLLPVTEQSQRALYRRIDTLELCYGLCMIIAEHYPAARPLRPNFHNSGPFDAIVTGEKDFNTGIMLMGNVLPFEDFCDRFRSLVKGRDEAHQWAQIPFLTLVIVPTSFEKNWITEQIIALRWTDKFWLVCTEYEATVLSPDTATWHFCFDDDAPVEVSLLEIVRDSPGDPTFNVLQPANTRLDPPVDCSQLLPVGLTAVQKRMLRCLADWQLLTQQQLASILTMRISTHFRQHLADLIERGMVVRENDRFGSLGLTEEGLGHLAQGDRTSVEAAMINRTLNGGQSAFSRRERNRTHGIIEVVRRIHAEYTGRVEALPAHRASRRYPVGGTGFKSLHPDAALLLRHGGDLQTLLLDYDNGASGGEEALGTKLMKWIRYYTFDDRQYPGSLSQSADAGNLDREVTLLVVPSDSIRDTVIRRCHSLLRRTGWDPGRNGSLPIAISTEREIESARSILADEIWTRLDDFQRRKVNPILLN